MTVPSVSRGGVAAAVPERVTDAAAVTPAASTNERTTFMVAHVVIRCPIARHVGEKTAHTVRCPGPVALVAMTDRAAQHGISYASAGVDIEAGDRAVELLKPLANKATRPEVRGGLGGFAGLFALRG